MILSTTAPSSPDEDAPILPQFQLAVFEDGADDVELIVQVPNRPSIQRHASASLLYGLAIMTLDREGVIADRIEALMQAGPISEVDAANRIALLLNPDTQ